MADPIVPTDSLHLRLAAANGLIRRRRSIKPDAMRNDPIDPMILGNMLENANWAPTHGLTEPWRFQVYEQAGLATLAEALQNIYRASTPPDQFREEKFLGFRHKVLQCGAVLVVSMKRQESGKIPEWEEIAAVACAVQNLHLTASAVGLGAYWSTPPLIDSGEMRAYLGLAPGDRCLGLFYLGWPRDPDFWPVAKRSPIREKIEWLDL